MDGRRFVLPKMSRGMMIEAAKACAQAAPACLLSLADVMGMPSGLHAAYVASLAALGRPIRWPVAGAAAAVLLRLVSGLDARWENLLTLLLLLPAPRLLRGRNNPALLLVTGLSLLPVAVRGWLAPTALPTLMALCSVAFSVLLAPVICRGLKAMSARDDAGGLRPLESVEDRIGVASLALLMMGGGAQLEIAGMNAGVAMASMGVLLLAMHMGAGAGCAAGVIAGMALGMMGLPVLLPVALAAGGFLAGAMLATERRWLCCASFGTAVLMVLLLAEMARGGWIAAIFIVTIGVMLLPERAAAIVHQQMARLRCVPSPASDAYAASMLAAWERTVDALAMSVPVPGERKVKRDAAWWQERLCGGCPEQCGGLGTAMAAAQAEEVWAYRGAEEPVWQGALEGLRGLGCQRLHHLQQGMEALRREDAMQRRHVAQAREQRSMLVTHLTAMAGAARRFAHLSQGESWWDALHARRIRAALSDAAAPVRLMWLRRIGRHVQAVFRLEDITNARRQAEELCELVAEATGVAMTTVSIDQGRIRIAQRPPLEAVCGVCSVSSDGQRVCGDTAWHGLLQDGRFMAALSDGMGHGDEAALSSRQTVELLRLCLDAGYTLEQTITVVNGMMMLGGSGERFTTVDMLLIDLWTGRVSLEKMGSAVSWLHQDGKTTPLTSDALPLGILEGAEAGERMLQLRPGDALVLMTDGVEEAFTGAEMEDAMHLALLEEPTQAALSLIQAAYRAAGGCRKDDQTVLVIRIEAVQIPDMDV